MPTTNNKTQSKSTQFRVPSATVATTPQVEETDLTAEYPETVSTKVEIVLRNTDERSKDRTNIEDLTWQEALDKYSFQRDLLTYVPPHPDMLNELLDPVAYICPRPERKGDKSKVCRIHYDASYVWFYFYRTFEPFMADGSSQEVYTTLGAKLDANFLEEKKLELRKRAIELVGNTCSPDNPRYDEIINTVISTLIAQLGLG